MGLRVKGGTIETERAPPVSVQLPGTLGQHNWALQPVTQVPPFAQGLSGVRTWTQSRILNKISNPYSLFNLPPTNLNKFWL